jgi:hypothetical protein
MVAIWFIDPHRKDGVEVSNHLKWLANELPITFIYAGLGLLKATERQLLLARNPPGMLVDLADYLFTRSTGHIGSFVQAYLGVVRHFRWPGHRQPRVGT